MALADPQTVTIDTVDHTLNRIKSDGYRSEYITSDEEMKLTVSHQPSSSRTRRMVRIDKKIVAADPLSSVNEYKNLGVYIVIDEPLYGFGNDDIDAVVAGLKALLSTELVTAVCSGQH